LRYCRSTAATDPAPCRTEPTNAAKSCIAPTKTQPSTIHQNAGCQPNAVAARIGPAIGPAAEIAEKCCDSR
jgi:hypothetical protein